MGKGEIELPQSFGGVGQERRDDREKVQVPPADPTETREGGGTTTTACLTKTGNIFNRAEPNWGLRAEPVQPPRATAPARAKSPIFSNFQAPNSPDFRASRAELRSPWARGCRSRQGKVAEPSPRWLSPRCPRTWPRAADADAGNVCWLQHDITAGEGSGDTAAAEMQQPTSQGGAKETSAGKGEAFHWKMVCFSQIPSPQHLCRRQGPSRI